MAAPAERHFWKTIQTRAFHGAYYLYGDDEYLKEQAVRQLLAAAVDPATRDFNLDSRNAGDLDAETLSSLVNTPPMMADRRVVVIRDVASLKKDARSALDDHLSRAAKGDASSTDVVLVLVAVGGEKAKDDRVLRKLPGAVEFAPLSGERVPRWITHYVATELGGSITPEAAALLQSAAGNDLIALSAELHKLVSYAGAREIDEAAVSAVVGVRRGETLGDFLDRVAARDAPGALELLSHVLEQPKTTAVSVVMALAVQTLALAWAEAQLGSGARTGRLESELFELLRGSGGAYTGRPWGEATRAWPRYLENWDASSLNAALDALLAADIALKETRLSSDEELLATLVIVLCTGDAALSASWRDHAAAVA